MKKLILILLAELMIGLSIYYYLSQKATIHHLDVDETLIEVSITGAVNSPGTYRLKKKSTLHDLISYAQDLTVDANVESLDFNKVIEHKTYHIPFYKTEEEQLHIVKVNLNDANLDLLKTIPGMTETRLENFIYYRMSVKVIYDIKELLKVKGIGKKTYEAMEKYVTV